MAVGRTSVFVMMLVRNLLLLCRHPRVIVAESGVVAEQLQAVHV